VTVVADTCLVVLDHRHDVYLNDLVHGIRTFCPKADVAIYDSGNGAPGFGTADELPRLPASRPLSYAKVTPFFLDLLEWAAAQNYNNVINVETDMAFLRPGFESFLRSAMLNADYLAPSLSRVTAQTSRWRPYRSLRAELPELLSILGTDHTNRCFSPGQVFSARFAERLLSSPWYSDVRAFVERNQQPGRSFSLQEVLLPTVAEVLGLRVSGYPAHLTRFNRYRPYHAGASVRLARATEDAYFVHPVRRDEADEARKIVRQLSRAGGSSPIIAQELA
jgi:hypothetical protein